MKKCTCTRPETSDVYLKNLNTSMASPKTGDLSNIVNVCFEVNDKISPKKLLLP